MHMFMNSGQGHQQVLYVFPSRFWNAFIIIPTPSMVGHVGMQSMLLATYAIFSSDKRKLE